MLTMTKAVPLNRGGVASGLLQLDARPEQNAPMLSWYQSNAVRFRRRPSHMASGGVRPTFGRDVERWDSGSRARVPLTFTRGIPPRGDALGAGFTVLPAIWS